MHKLAHITDYINMHYCQLFRLKSPAMCHDETKDRMYNRFLNNSLRTGLAVYTFASYIRSAEDIISINRWIEKYYLCPEEISGQ